MGDLTTKTVKVPSSKAEEWDTHVEKNAEVDSISHLIRLSVEREIQGRYDQPQTLSDDTDDAASGEVLTALRQIQTGMSDLEERMSAIEKVDKAEASYDLKKAIWALLPEDPEHVTPEDEIPAGVPHLPEESGAVTADKIARQLGADTGEVKDTLDELVESTGQIQCNDTNYDGEYYWKKGR